jgi:hypothetical protein
VPLGVVPDNEAVILDLIGDQAAEVLGYDARGRWVHDDSLSNYRSSSVRVVSTSLSS